MRENSADQNLRIHAEYRLPLFKRYPELEGVIPRVSLGNFPTPVQRLSHLGHDNLWIKRDDLSSDIYGGNKVRKLEFILADAIKKGRDMVITMGGIGTNHGLASAIFCHKLGLRCKLLLFHQPVNAYVKRNLLLFLKYGAELVYLKSLFRTAATLLLTQRVLNPRAYILGAGGSSPLGTLGIVNAMFELKEQIDAGIVPEPRYIFCPLGSNGTMAGLSLGAMLAGLSTTVIGVRVTMEFVGPIAIASAKTAEGLMQKTYGLLIKKHVRVMPDITIPPQRVINDHVGDGYGCATRECREALSLMNDREGIALDPTYTAKTFAALCDFIKIPGHKNEPILFWHTYSSADMTDQAQSDDYRGLPPALRLIYEKESEGSL